MKKSLSLLFTFISCVIISYCQPEAVQKSHNYRDLFHNSKVFGHKKYYRIYLPEHYASSAGRYPVIYFFHGWGGRYFKDDNARLEYDKIIRLVDKYQVILVMWDGSMDEQEPRPYNIGNHKEIKYQVQMKDYFPELVKYIDATYPTLTDRYNRGIIGFSMGGFMSFFLAGKYPDKVCAAVSLAGSPEFFVGYPDQHTLYPVRYMFKNLRQVNTRLQSGDTDILVYLNEEVNKGAKWEGGPYEFYPFHGGHMVDLPGETFAFEKAMKFISETFKKKTKATGWWSHYDIYPEFEVWGYQVKTDKKEPGFIFLKHVSKKGFGVYTYQWLPKGASLKVDTIKVNTSPVYVPQKIYQIVQLNVNEAKVSLSTIKSNVQGRLAITVNAAGNEVGIFASEDSPEFVLTGYSLEGNGRYLKIGSNHLSLQLFNRGGESGLPRELQITIHSADSMVVADTVIFIKAMPGQRIITLPPLNAQCFKTAPSHAEPPEVKFRIAITWNKYSMTDDLEIPVFFDANYFSHVQIDDGIMVKDSIWGSGNADHTANAGEKILAYECDKRLRLYTEDPWVIHENEKLVDEVIQPGIWPDGFTLSSIIHISPDCPDGHVIECLASYETKTYNPIERKVIWGKIRIPIQR